MEQVNHPSHYQGENGIEAIDAIEAALTKTGAIDFSLGNAIKYLFRAQRKHDDPTIDLKKAMWYIEKAIELYDSINKKSNDI